MRILVVDGGGSKTRSVVFEDNDVIFEGSGGPSNPVSVGVDEALRSIEEALNGFDRNVDTAVFGLAGVGFSKELREKMEGELERIVNSKRVIVLSDIHLSVVGALGGKEGVVVIAGTGSVVVGFKDGKFHRVGGWGYLLGDEGSGYRLSIDSLRYTLKFYEGRAKRSKLVDEIEAHFKVRSDRDVLKLIYLDGISRREISSFARRFLSVVSEGDGIAIGILKRNISELAEGVKFLCDKLDVERVSYSGGLFESEVYKGHFKKELERHGIELREGEGTPIDGGVILARWVSKGWNLKE